MLRAGKPEGEGRFELLTWGVVLLTGAILYVTANKAVPSLTLLLPGMLLLASLVYQDFRPGWHAGWASYVFAIMIVGIGFSSLINNVASPAIPMRWWITTIGLMGTVLILKAFWDPTPIG